MAQFRRSCMFIWHRFADDRRGSLVVWFALGLVPLLYAMGAGLDYGRSLNLKSQIQGAADSAALAGATAYVGTSSAATAKTIATNYMSNFVSSMPSASAITYTVTTGSKAAGSNATVYTVSVAASGKIANSIMAMTTPTNSITIAATAQNPVYTLTLTLLSYSSSAADSNTIFYYLVPADNGIPSDQSAYTQFYTNNGNNSNSNITIQLTAGQKIGFLLLNTTGGRTGSYGTNGYGGANNSTHYFFSHIYPPSAYAYSSVTRNCNLQVTSSTAAVTGGSCFSSLFPNSAVNCGSSAASGQTLIYSWNDMGGKGDDYDYNDMVYSVKCSQNDPSLGNGVVLTN